MELTKQIESGLISHQSFYIKHPKHENSATKLVILSVLHENISGLNLHFAFCNRVVASNHFRVVQGGC